MDDASLDEFLGDASEDSGGTEDGTETTESETAPGGDRDGDDAQSVDPATVTPATSTYAWHAEDQACAACGEPVGRRWRDEAGLVCTECKEW